MSSETSTNEIQSLKSQINDLKKTLVNREARIMAMQNILNMVITSTEAESNKLFRELQTKSVGIANIITDGITKGINDQLQTIPALSEEQQTMLCERYRSQEGLTPIEFDVVSDKEDNL